jgi:hypothetical protein
MIRRECGLNPAVSLDDYRKSVAELAQALTGRPSSNLAGAPRNIQS